MKLVSPSFGKFETDSVADRLSGWETLHRGEL